MSVNNKYLKSKIYKLTSASTEKCYVGSTCKDLKRRLQVHKSAYKGRHGNCSSFEIVKYEDVQIVMIEEYKCDTKRQLLEREGFWIKQLDCVNKYIAGRTVAQYRKDNIDIIRLRDRKRDRKRYRKRYEEGLNRKQIKDKQIREINKAKLKEWGSVYYECVCGSEIMSSGKSEHEKSMKHIKFMNS